MTDRYPVEVLGEDDDNGTMPSNIETLRESVVGDRIVKVEKAGPKDRHAYGSGDRTILTLASGRRVALGDTNDCCAHTYLDEFLLHPDKVDHMIMGVGTTGGYTRWHIYADLGDVLELQVEWSPGNPFYYGYGFDIDVDDSDLLPPVSEDEIAEALESIQKAVE